MNASYSPISSPSLFDTSLLLHRLRKYEEQHDFLSKHAIQSFSDRLNFIKRQFNHVALMGHGVDQLYNLINEMGHGGQEVLVFSTTKPNIDSEKLLLNEVVPFAAKSMDLIIANLNLHWINDLPGFLWQVRESLKPDGLFLGSLVGGHSLYELKESFRTAELNLYGGGSARVVPMTDAYSASQLLLRANFKLPVCDIDKITVTYPNLTKLAKDLQRIGQTNILTARHKSPTPRQLWQQTEEIYQNTFGLENGKIPATFEVIYLTGWAEHKTQQKPLLPGSAILKLEDSLNDK